MPVDNALQVSIQNLEKDKTWWLARKVDLQAKLYEAEEKVDRLELAIDALKGNSDAAGKIIHMRENKVVDSGS